jgi:uncharacterized membrane protein YcaP (DUF421 family)
MDFTIIWKSFVLIIAGILLLRISGRKSISQMTLAQTVVMISMGTIIVQPIVEKSVTNAIIGAATFVVANFILEYLELKFNFFEKFLTGKSKTVIENGKLNVQNLKKLRLTVDQLEMRIRNQGISTIEDIKTATIEPNGQLGYELIDNAKPLTVGEFSKLLDLYFSPQPQQSTDQNKPKKLNIFEEINSSRPQNQEHPKRLK